MVNFLTSQSPNKSMFLGGFFIGEAHEESGGVWEHGPSPRRCLQ